jgi:hypothetical protein
MTLSYTADIKPLFTPNDINCMNGHGVFLGNVGYMTDPDGDDGYADHANARSVHDHLTGVAPPRMPPGQPWSADRIAQYKQWMDDGFAP